MNKRTKMFICCSMGIGCILMLYLFVALYLSKPEEEAPKEEAPAIYENACLLSILENQVTFLVGKEVHTFPLSESEDAVANLEEVLKEEMLADLVVDDGSITEITLKQEKLMSDEFQILDDTLTLAEGTSYSLEPNFQAYDRALQRKLSKNQLYGYEEVTFFLEGGKIAGAFAKTSTVPSIRIALMTTGFAELTHKNCELHSEGDMHLSYTLTDGTKREETVKAGEKVAFTWKETKEFTDVLITTANTAIIIDSIQRNKKAGSYAGSLMVSWSKEGFYLVNELSLEEYLYGVLPSEIPSSYHLEASKAQAICARSYAYNSLSSPRYPDIRANLDDSTNCQVYNNQEISEAAIQAVDETAGELLLFGEKPVTTYYYSTSCGMGARIDEIWNTKESEYLLTTLHAPLNGSSALSKTVFAKIADTEIETLKQGINLSKEEDFQAFIDESCVKLSFENMTLLETVESYDRENAWFRWEAAVELESFSETVNERIQSYAAEYADTMKVTDKDGKQATQIGKITKLEIKKRGTSGVAMEVCLTGEKGTCVLTRQTVIRTILSLKGEALTRNDGKEIDAPSLLPSAFFYTKIEEGELHFFGGGYGHGVGMSQNAANTMAEQGSNSKEILYHFYPGTKVSNYYAGSESTRN